MPLYEYRCNSCRRRSTLLTRSIAQTPDPVCEHCGSRDMARLVSSFAVVRGPGGESLDAIPDEAFADVDEDNPREVARWMRRMKEHLGETTPEFDEMVDSLEAGELPEDDDGGMDDAGDDDLDG